MNLKSVGSSFALLLSLLAAAALRAQTAGVPPAPPPPPPSYPYDGSVITSGTTNVVADITVPYAFNFNNVGIVGDLGGLWNNNFLGGEISYYDALPDHHDWYYPGGGYGWHHYNEQITATNFAYRRYFPLMLSGWEAPNTAFYLGGSVGAAWIDTNSGYYPGAGPNYYESGGAHLDANGVAGFQWNFSRSFGVKLGYRYIWVNNAHLFYTDKRLDSSAVEASLAFHF